MEDVKMGQLFAVEVVYRGVFQKILAKNITRGIVFAAHNEGKLGISFGRYGDSPERNGIPAKSFAIIASDEEMLQVGMVQYEPKQVDLTIVIDDTLCKGVESWSWYGLRAVNGALKPGHPLIVVSMADATALVKNTPGSPPQALRSRIAARRPPTAGEWRQYRAAEPRCLR